MTPPVEPDQPLRVAAALSGHPDGVNAAQQVCRRIIAELGADLDQQHPGGGESGDDASASAAGSAGPTFTSTPVAAFLFISGHHLEQAKAIAFTVRTALAPASIVGASAASVIGGETELEDSPGVSVLVIAGGGVRATLFDHSAFPPHNTWEDGDPHIFARAIGLNDRTRAVFLFADPFSVPMNTLLPVLGLAVSAAGGEHGSAPVLGGMASAGDRPDTNALFVNDSVHRRGLVGLTLEGDVRVDPLVSQGCRPFGQTHVVTKAKGQVLMSLGNQPALRVLEHEVRSMPEEWRDRLSQGVFLGRAATEQRERFGRDDFLIRGIVGADEASGAIAVGDLLRAGQTVRFHHRDTATAQEDLSMLLDIQSLRGKPAGVLLFTCNGRGMNLFQKPHHDAAAIVNAFRPEPPGEQRAKGGTHIQASGSQTTVQTSQSGQPNPAGGTGDVPLAGFFAAGEIGPVGESVYLHGHTACAAFIRQDRADNKPDAAPGE